MLKVSFKNQEFTTRSTFEERLIPRKAGFSFDRVRKCWYSFDHQAAARLRPYLDESAKKEISRILLTYRPWTGCVPYPTGLKPELYQVEAARFALSRNRSYLGLDPGLGKTIVAAMITNAKEGRDFLYICPPFLIPNVRAEIQRWTVREKRILGFFTLIPDSQLDNLSVMADIRRVALGDAWLIVDEAHRFCNPTAKRTKALFGTIAPLFQNQIYMSGTPMRNRSMELFPILSNAAPETIGFMSKFDYGRRYCAAHHNGFGWDFSGSSNVKELKAKTQVTWEEYEESGDPGNRFMLRVRKDVLNLPPKLEEIVLIADDLPAKVGGMDKAIIEKFGGSDDMAAVLAKNAGKDELHISTYRKELGKAKADAAIPFIKAILEDTDENLIVATWHKEAMARLKVGLSKFDPIIIDGSVAPELRVPLANEFQKNPKKRLVILNIIAGGIGINLQKANRVIFAEASWVPGDNDQASDRAHRYGTKNTVLVQYLVYRNSVDCAVLEAVLKKRRVTHYI